MTTNLDSVIEFINNELNTRQDIDRVRAALHGAMDRNTSNLTRQFRIGDTVEWDSKYGSKMSGRITKINNKSIKVLVNNGDIWTVSPGLLRKVE